MFVNRNKSYPDSGKNPACFERRVVFSEAKTESVLVFLFPSGIIPNSLLSLPVPCEEREGNRHKPSLRTVLPESFPEDKMALRKQNPGENAPKGARARSSASIYLDSTKSGASVPRARLDMLVSSWLLAANINNFSPATLASYRSRLKLFKEWCDREGIEEIGKQEVMLHLAYYRNERNVSPTHLKNIYAILQSFFNWCVREDYLNVSPMQGIQIPREPKSKPHPYTDDEVRGMLSATLHTQQPRRDEAIFRLVLDTGIRSSELCALLISDVNLDSAEIRIRKGKGGKSRTVPICTETRKAILAYLLRDRPRFEESDPLFVSCKGHTAGGALTRIGIYKMFSQWAKDAGISRERIGAHTVRHTFGSGYINNDGDPFSLKEMMGHESLSTTMIYVQVGREELKRKHAQFSPASGLKVDRSKGGKKR